MRMAVDARRGAVGGPSSVSNAGVRVKDLCLVELGLLHELLEGGDLADLLDREHLVLLVTVNGETCRVVTAVL